MNHFKVARHIWCELCYSISPGRWFTSGAFIRVPANEEVWR